MQALSSFLLLFTFWIILSGKFDAFHLALGVLSAFLVTIWSKDLLFSDQSAGLGKRLRIVFRFIGYFFWLNWQIIVANVHVVFLAFHPNLKSKINPKFITFKRKMPEFSQFFLANSITLTPGTITVSVAKDEFIVHALTDEFAKACPGDMVGHVERIFQ